MTHRSGLLALTDDKTRRLRMSQMPEFVEAELDTSGVDLVELHGMVMRDQPLPSKWDPKKIVGLTVWLDASQLALADGGAVTSWPDLSGLDHHGNVVASPPPLLRHDVLNGKPVVRFKANEGRIRGDGMITDPDTSDVTVIYVGRMWGPNVGRIFTNTYPPHNFLVGTHTSGVDSMYDNGWVAGSGGWPGGTPTPWKLYGATCTMTPRMSTFYVDGAVRGSLPLSTGHDSRWNLSGYDATGTPETCDCEVAELVTWNRKLADDERVRTEEYLREKWGL